MGRQEHPVASDVTQRVARLSSSARALLDERLRAGRADPAPVSAAIPRLDAAEAPLSFAQERLWFIERLEDDAVHHNDATLLILTGSLDRAALQRGIEEVVRRHEILRTAFRQLGERVVQAVTPPAPLTIDVVDLPGATARPDDAVLRAAVEREMRVPLDLAAGQTIRAVLYRIAPDVHVLGVTVHHLVCDLWSFTIFCRELAATYAAFASGTATPDLPELPIQYADYAAWQRTAVGEERMAAHLRERVAELAGVPPLLTLPTRGPRPAVQQFVGASEWFRLGSADADRIRALGQRQGATTYMTLLAAFTALLARHSGQRDMVVASPIATRDQHELEHLIGCFLNMIVVRADLSGDPTFAELVARVKAASLDAFRHRDVPFERLVAALQPERSRSHQPLAQVAFVLQNVPAGGLDLPELRVDVHQMETGRSRMDLTVKITETVDGLVGEFEYDTSLFTGEAIRALARQFELLLVAAARQPDTSVWRLPLLDDAQRHRILHEWNDTALDLGPEALVHRLVEAQARRTPDAVAVVEGNVRTTYRELDERANRLAHHLRDLGVGVEDPVAVCLPRCTAEVVAILAVLKAGGYHLPVNPRDPQARRDALLGQVRPAVAISAGDLCDEVWSPGRRIIDLDGEASLTATCPATDPAVPLHPDNLAYTLFTSGSTGQPKGVQVTHRGFTNRMLWAQRNFPLGQDDRVLRKAACTFDVSLDELFRALFNGAASVLMPETATFDPRRLAGVIARHGVTDADFAPTALREVLLTADAADLKSLRRIVSGVEELTPETQRLVFDRLDVTMFNLYGPTEVSVSCTAWPCDPDDERPFVPIGRPMANVRVYVLDEAMEPVPPGVAGEVYVGGAGLARGYLDNSALTAERFLPDPFAGTPGARVYRTGDLARFGPDGVLEFLGRGDGQLNLRGYRIEPGEVESALRRHPAVREAAVVVRRDPPGRDARLVGYVVGDDLPGTADLRAHLRRRLPDYLVPAAFVRLPRLPLTNHGKLDVAALPPPGQDEPGATGADGPRDERERVLLDIWCDVLGREGIGIHDDFFDLGGDSLTATRIVALAGAKLGADVEVAVIFDAPTVAELAARLAPGQP
ncbi:amino acid adenylation domain-containing protein [Micromonospora sp. NPDC023633]|uniref:non-ribosomal peptide synthetase n=1 Tax=Micromonospora sp. NPDC023633 TaxID=3154320 RepID=UPI0033FD61FA